LGKIVKTHKFDKNTNHNNKSKLKWKKQFLTISYAKHIGRHDMYFSIKSLAKKITFYGELSFFVGKYFIKKFFSEMREIRSAKILINQTRQLIATKPS
jgi:hypothetical protein